MKKKVINKLFFQVVMHFAAIVLIFAALMSVIFMKAYESDSSSSYNQFLSEQVEIIAERMQQYVLSQDIDSYLAYMEMLEDSLNADVWIFSNSAAENPMSEALENINITDSEMSKENRYVLNQAYLGKTVSKEGFSQVRDENVITIGAPIYTDNSSTDIVGAVLLLAPLESEQNENGTNIKVMFFASIFAAMTVAFILAALFARRICNPITKIEKTTKELAEGKYDTVTDISERNEIGQLAESVDILAERLKENEVQRKYLEQMRMDFFSNVSHELRTPITVLRAYLESLVDGVVSEDKVSVYYSRMLGECAGMQRLIQDLLLLSKMENPDFTIELEPVNIVQVLDDTIRNFRLVCAEKQIKIDVEKDREYGFINGDYDRIRQVFIAILDNAIKFSKKESTIYIKIRTSEKIIVSIKDEGTGMDKEEMTHIFDRFYTKKTTSNKNGSGLGLVIAKEIMKKHNGIISVSSEVEKGTEFVLTLPQITIDENFE